MCTRLQEKSGCIQQMNTYRDMEKHYGGLTCVVMVSQFCPLCFYKGNSRIISLLRKIE
jgi:hypothetical protein